LNSLPRALRLAAERGRNRPLDFSRPTKDHGEELGISRQFLPIHIFKLRDVKPNCEDATKDEQLMMSFQAVGILGLPSELLMTEFPNWEKWEVAPQHRQLFLRSYDLTKLAQEYRWPQPGETGFDQKANDQRLADTRQKFLTMEPLFFIKYADFVEAVKQPEYDHLHGLKMRSSTYCRVIEDTGSMGLDLLFAEVEEKPPSMEAGKEQASE